MTDETSAFKRTEGLLGQLQASLPQAIAELEEAQERIGNELRRLRRTYNALGNERPAISAKAKSSPRSRGVGSYRVLQVAEAIVSLNHEKFTVLDVYATLKDEISEPSAYMCFKRLYEMEFIARAGKAQPIRPGTTPRILYSLDRLEILDHLRSANGTQESHQSRVLRP